MANRKERHRYISNKKINIWRWRVGYSAKFHRNKMSKEETLTIEPNMVKRKIYKKKHF